MSEKLFRSSVAWSYGGAWFRNFFVAINSLLVAAIVGPIAFGVVAMALLWVALGELILDQGFSAALVQRKEITPTESSTVFWFCFFLSIGLYVVTVLIGSVWSQACNLPVLFPLIAVLSLSLPLTALVLVPQSMMQREMKFKELAIRSNYSTVLGGLFGIVSAFFGLETWALVIQHLSTQVISLILTLRYEAWRPQWLFSSTALRCLGAFAFGVFFTRLAILLNRRIEVLFGAYFLNATAVGILRLSDRLVTLCLESSAKPVQGPAFRHIAAAADGEQRTATILQVIRLTTITTCPVLLVLAGSADIIPLILGRNWDPVVNPIRFFAFIGSMQSVAMCIGPVLNALGRPFELGLIIWVLVGARFIAMASFLPFFSESSPTTQVAVVALIQFVSFVFLYFPLNIQRLLSTKIVTKGQLLRAVSPGILAASFGGVASYGLWIIVGNQNLLNNAVFACFVPVCGIAVSAAFLYLLCEEVRGLSLSLFRRFNSVTRNP